MSRYRLTYFDIDGGRAEPIRISFHAGDIPFEDNRLSFPEFGKMRADTRFNSVPVLEIDDDIVVTQSNAIAVYVGKLAKLYPEDPMQALFCDEALGALEDLSHYIVRTFGLQGEALAEARAKLVDGWLTTYLRGLSQLLERGGDYLCDGQLTVADLKLFVQTRSLRKGTLDHVPTDLVDRLAPNLVAHQERIASDPRVVAYYASR